MRTALCIGILILGISPFGVAQESPFQPRPERVVGTTSEGIWALTPGSVETAHIGDYVLRYTVGASGIAPGGGLMADFPKAWFTNPAPLVKPVQTDDPDAPHYMGVSVARDGARFEMDISQRAFDGSIERFRHVVELKLEGTALEPGDLVEVVFANTTAPIVSGRDRVNVALDAGGSGEYRLHTDAKTMGVYEVLPGSAAYFLLTAPSLVQTGETVYLSGAVLDRLYNPIPGHRAMVTLHGLGDSPREWSFTADASGRAELEWTPQRPRDVVVRAETPLTSVGVPVRIVDTHETNLYWGDLHSHSDMSKDGIGHGDFEYARDVAGLDFFARTEHGGDDGYAEATSIGDSIAVSEWERTREEVQSLYQPGRYVTILAYECGLSGGHHNVFFRGVDGAPWPGYRVKVVEALWELLEAGEALTIPHHLGVQWGGGPTELTGPGLQEVTTGLTFLGGPRLDWSREHRADLRPALEMYSKHGQSEYYDREDPLSYEQVRYTRGRSADGPHYAQDAWRAGHVLGTIAASDNHTAHPGLPHTGLTAVYADALSRDGVFDALLERRAYATTGVRMILDFEIGDAQMGEIAEVSGTLEGNVDVLAPLPIRFAEVLASSGGGEWRTVRRWDSPGESIRDTFAIEVESDTVAYLRVELAEPVWGRTARGWTSPIWLRP